tara:strand:- start:379 stop:699 length:321 start_codon:yes stop_codon:yes gene_type:complete
MSDRIKIINLHAQARELNALSEHRLKESIYSDIPERGKYLIQVSAHYELRQWLDLGAHFESSLVYKAKTKRGLFDAIQCAIDILQDNKRAKVNNHWDDKYGNGRAL